MKKQIIAAAIAAAVAAPAAMAGAPTVYGQINMSLDHVSIKDAHGYKDKTNGGVRVTSNASRIGVKGSEDLGNGLKALYKIEWGVDVDGDKGRSKYKATESISARNAYVGLGGSFGAVLLGRHDSPFKMAQPTDTFNDGYGDNGRMAGLLGLYGAGGELRAGNVLAYVSPSFNGIKFVGALVPNEELGVANKESGLTDIYSAALMYGSKKKGLYLSAAMTNADKNSVDGTHSYSEYRLSAQYTMGDLMANVMYQDFDTSKVKAANDGSNWQINLAYTMGAATLKGKYSSVDYDVKSQKDASAYGLGVDYALGKKTTAYVEYVATDNYSAEADAYAIGKKAEDTYVSVGMIHKF
ncbi:Outer membrane protein (porin) [Sulfurivirga caldicuralii]|uniref:Outer membrane protein (Porin) n=1 Tax=Sulfurivirga caldicuralii TaxID=364032 RepID=A0A1N6GGM9_9GAMM|nr:porin [Sulfurivirga caldicuralii]SIO06654.1 Outer membrane protein (porin) [Sulfurivirga caldicuralii]